MPDDVKYLAITDIETTGLDVDNDVVLEVATILVDMDLNEISRFQAVLRASDEALGRLRLNEYVLRMHQKSGLLADAMLSDQSLSEVESEWERFLYTKTVMLDSKIALAGSGVGHFDMQWIRKHFPDVSHRFVYYPYDIGDFRRITTWWNGGQSVIPPVEESFVDGIKVHRAMADAQAHYEEFKRYRQWFNRPSMNTVL